MKDIVIGKLLAHSCGGFVCAMWVSTWWVRARLKSLSLSILDDLTSWDSRTCLLTFNAVFSVSLYAIRGILSIMSFTIHNVIHITEHKS